MKSSEISKEKGKYLIIRLDAGISRLIAEVTQKDPLRVKVTETGKYSWLKGESDFIILENETLMAQGDEEEQQKLLREAVEQGRPLLSGLVSLGVKDDLLHEILPVNP